MDWLDNLLGSRRNRSKRAIAADSEGDDLAAPGSNYGITPYRESPEMTGPEAEMFKWALRKVQLALRDESKVPDYGRFEPRELVTFSNTFPSLYAGAIVLSVGSFPGFKKGESYTEEDQRWALSMRFIEITVHSPRKDGNTAKAWWRTGTRQELLQALLSVEDAATDLRAKVAKLAAKLQEQDEYAAPRWDEESLFE